MTESSSLQSDRHCGACGAVVAADAVTCPTCGAYLAAYEVTTGAGLAPDPASSVIGPAQSSATLAVPSAPGATTPIPSQPVSQRPTSSSGPAPGLPAAPIMPSAPIAAPLRLVDEGRTAEAARSRSPIADALEDMKSGDSGNDLSEMASGEDVLAEMAAGENDEFARMATGGGPSLAQQIKAQLSGARINYSGDQPEIVPKPDAPTPMEAPERATPRPEATSAAPKPAAPQRAQATPTVSGTAPAKPAPARAQARPIAPGTESLEPARTQVRNDDLNPPIAWVDTDRAGRVIGTRAGSPPSTQAAKNVPWAVIGVVGCVLFGMLSRAGSTGVLLFVVIFALAVGWFVMRMAGMTGRKSTHMPKDPQIWRGPRR